MHSRIKSITTLQSLAIFFVVLGHSLPLNNMSGMRPLISEWIYRFVYSFHFHLFIFISGFLFIYTNIDRKIIYSQFLLKKIKRIFLPYFVITTIAFLCKTAFSQYAMRPLSFSVTDYFTGIAFPKQNPIIYFWFLPTIFILLSLAPLIKVLLHKNNIIVSLGILPLLIFLNVANPVRIDLLCIGCAASTLVFFYLGCIVAYYLREKLNYLKNHYLTISLLFVLILCTAYSIQFGQPIKLVPAIIGIAFSVSLAYLLKNTIIFKLINGYYYQIYLLSWFPQVFFQILYKTKFINYGLAVGTMLLAGLYLPIIISKFMEKKFARLKIVIGL